MLQRIWHLCREIRSPLNQFDLLGVDEIGLSKAFAYVLGREPIALYRFLQHLGISIKNTPRNFKATSIRTERVRKEGRTDIEIRQKGKFHLIVECKVRSNKIQSQRTQYLKSFSDDPQKVLCFVTQQNDFKKQIMQTYVTGVVGNLIFKYTGNWNPREVARFQDRPGSANFEAALANNWD